MSKIQLLFQKTNLDLVLKKCTSMFGSIFNTKSTCFQRFVPAGYAFTPTTRKISGSNVWFCIIRTLRDLVCTFYFAERKSETRSFFHNNSVYLQYFPTIFQERVLVYTKYVNMIETKALSIVHWLSIVLSCLPCFELLHCPNPPCCSRPSATSKRLLCSFF